MSCASLPCICLGQQEICKVRPGGQGCQNMLLDVEGNQRTSFCEIVMVDVIKAKIEGFVDQTNNLPNIRVDLV